MALVLVAVIAVLVLAAVIVAVKVRVLDPIDRLIASYAPVESQLDGTRVGRLRRLLDHRDVELSSLRDDSLRSGAVLDAVTAGVIVVDQAGEEIVRNSAARKLSSDQVAGAIADPQLDELMQLALGGNQASTRIEIYGPPRRSFVAQAAPIDVEGTFVGAVAVIEDETDGQRVDEMRRDFVANLSHELRTPIGAISLLAETLVDERDPETADRLAKRLVSESSRLAEIIDGLLELSRIEHDGAATQDRVAVQAIVEDAVARMRVKAEVDGISIGTVTPDDVLYVEGDPQQLASAVSNLVENSVKYSERGDTVSVRARRTDDDQVEVVVQDTGIGIPQADLERVFERFYRVDRSRRLDTGGTGLGLAIVRHVVLNHAGTVAVDSLEGEGTTVTVELPLMTGVSVTSDHSEVSR